MSAIDEPLAWLRANYPRGPWDDIDPRCIAVLTTLAPIYRLPIETSSPRAMIPYAREYWSRARMEEMGVIGEYPVDRRTDGGIRHIGRGAVAVRLTTDLATHDFNELTTLVLAAHQHHCRIQIGAHHVDDDFEDMDPTEAAQQASGVTLMIHPRVPADVDPNMSARHPGLNDLRKMIDNLDPTTTTKEPACTA